jgi:hypothetical protein
MNSKNHVRLVVAVLVSALLAVFLLYTSVAKPTPSQPQPAPDTAGVVTLARRGDRRTAMPTARRCLLRRHLRGAAIVAVTTEEVPSVQGRTARAPRGRVDGTFVATPDSLVTKSPRYVAKERQADGTGRCGALALALGLYVCAALAGAWGAARNAARLQPARTRSSPHCRPPRSRRCARRRVRAPRLLARLRGEHSAARCWPIACPPWGADRARCSCGY